jgi:hypothetical protein
MMTKNELKALARAKGIDAVLSLTHVGYPPMIAIVKEYEQTKGAGGGSMKVQLWRAKLRFKAAALLFDTDEAPNESPAVFSLGDIVGVMGKEAHIHVIDAIGELLDLTLVKPDGRKQHCWVKEIIRDEPGFVVSSVVLEQSQVTPDVWTQLLSCAAEMCATNDFKIAFGVQPGKRGPEFVIGRFLYLEGLKEANVVRTVSWVTWVADYLEQTFLQADHR